MTLKIGLADKLYPVEEFVVIIEKSTNPIPGLITFI